MKSVPVGASVKYAPGFLKSIHERSNSILSARRGVVVENGGKVPGSPWDILMIQWNDEDGPKGCLSCNLVRGLV